MDNPYRAQPDFAYWKRVVSSVSQAELDPVTEVPFRIGAQDRVATAGSCFAQHISRTLAREGFRFFVTEGAPLTDGAEDEGYGVYPARFGNVYTVRQLAQLFERAYGIFEPRDRAWVRPDGKLVDPFRPVVQASGFASLEELEADRVAHLRAVREMFEECDVFVFTLGLTEGWVDASDGAVVPLAPGVVAAPRDESSYAFRNFDVDEMVADLRAFIEGLRVVNPGVRIILTVSPVPLVATYEPRHVLVSTSWSKAALRVVAEQVTRGEERVVYFPSYEIITHPNAQYFEADQRTVTPSGVAHVMGVFARHFLGTSSREDSELRGLGHASTGAPLSATEEAELRADHEVICDEELLDG